MKTPRWSCVTLAVVTSANQTAPSGATANRPRLTIGVDSGNERMLPSGEIREIARFGVSVYQTPPAASTASPSGSRFWVPLGKRSILPFRNTAIASENSMVNQTAPLGATASAVGISVLTSMRYSIKPGSDQGLNRQTRTPRPATNTIVAGTSHTGRRQIRRGIVIAVLFKGGSSPSGGLGRTVWPTRPWQMADRTV